MAQFGRLFSSTCRGAAAPLGAAVIASYLVSATESTNATAKLEPALSPNEWRPFTVLSIEKLSPNTNKYTFMFPDMGAEAGLPVASCLLTKANIGAEKPDGTRKPVIRPYTPTSSAGAVGHLDLVVKIYEAGVMSAHIGKLAVGDALEMKGPIVKLPYEANTWPAIGMVAGGTGITPMLQVAAAALADPADKTKVSLVYGNVAEEDMLLRDEIDAMAKAHPDRFEVFYVLDKPPASWTGGAGYVTPEMLATRLPAPGSGAKVLVCGPPGLMGAVSGAKVSPRDQGELAGALAKLGYSKDEVFKF